MTMDLGFGKAVQVDHLTPHEIQQVERVFEQAEQRLKAGSSTSPVDHIKAGHQVVAFWPTDTKGYLQLFEGSDDIDVMDTESLDAGETDQISCYTCDLDLDVTDEKGIAYI